jgi:hypothetical protein
VTTIGEWIGEREPAPPHALLRRLREALGADARREADDAAELCLAAGERVLSAVLREDEASRNFALDLLAADALVTYAFEAASERPGELSERARHAMSSIAALGVTTSTDGSAGRA